MSTNIKSNEFHEHIAKVVLLENPSEMDVKCLMLLFHACNIKLSSTAMVGDVRGFAPITTRHIAEVAASLFSDSPKDTPNYWYDKWNGDWAAYALLENVPSTLLEPLKTVRDALVSNELVETITDEDWELIACVDQFDGSLNDSNG